MIKLYESGNRISLVHSCVSAVLEVSSTVRSCAWSPECKLLAAACSNATTVIWKDDGVHAYERIYTLKGHENEVRSVSWNERGQLLATCGGDKSVWVWEGLPGDEFDCATVLQGHTDDVNTVEWYYDDLFSASCDNTIKVDGLTFKLLLKKEKAHETNINSVKWHSGDKRLLASASDDGTLKIWEFICPWPLAAY
ncbi:hypothetical protein P3S68_029011 [Capsicum galapagoense]